MKGAMMLIDVLSFGKDGEVKLNVHRGDLVQFQYDSANGYSTVGSMLIPLQNIKRIHVDYRYGMVSLVDNEDKIYKKSFSEDTRER